MSIHLRFFTVWGTTGVGEHIERRIFAQDAFAAKLRFYDMTGIVADGAEAD